MANGNIDRKHIAVLGAGSAGLTAAKQVLEEGHRVTVYERTDFIGESLRWMMVLILYDNCVILGPSQEDCGITTMSMGSHRSCNRPS